jgi:cell fate (sporulation/competence/biofilm development) regulator YlbF (YheA/YmcA/DUF963 family)
MLSPSDLSDDELDQIVSDPDDHSLEEASLPHDEIDEEDDTDDDHDEAIELVREIQELAEEMPEKGESFAESAVAKALSIQQTIEENEKVTTGQLTALRNMKAGLEKWIR